MLILLERVGRLDGARGERWPHLGVFVHGGVSFAPYRGVFEQWLGRPKPTGERRRRLVRG